MTSAAAARRAPRVDPALFLRETIGVFFAQLQIEVWAGDVGVSHLILRRYTAIVFHLDVEILAGQDSFSQVQNLREGLGIQSMIDIIGDIRLEQTSVLSVVQRAAAIDKAFRHVADLGDVEMRRDRVAVGQDETRPGIRMLAENRFKFMKLHLISIYLHEYIVNAA